MLQACVQCHDFKNIVAQRKTPEAWRRTVDEMAWRGAPLMPGEAEVLCRYLASSFGADKLLGASVKGDTPRTKFAQYLPEGKGRDLVLQSCVECHDLENVVSMRGTADEWRLTVKKMIRLGAEIDSSDAETIISYLSSSFAADRPIPDGLKKKR
jgi:mono/diheme cytochrome c family protein